MIYVQEEHINIASHVRLIQHRDKYYKKDKSSSDDDTTILITSSSGNDLVFCSIVVTELNMLR